MQTAKGKPTLSDVEQVLAQSRLLLKFPRRLEELYLSSYMAQRAPMVPVWTMLGVVLFCLNHMGDLSMMAPNSDVLFWMRFGVIAPYGFLVILVMRFWPTAVNYELSCIGIGILGTLLPMSVLAVTQSEYAFVYQTGTVSTLLYMVVLLRPRFYAALIGSLGILAIQLTTTAMNGGFDEVTYTGIVTFYVTFTVFLLGASFGMDRGARYSFLQYFRNVLLTEQLRYQSDHDDLSGLKNRRALKGYLEELWRDRQHETVTAIMIDIDDFKLYNDVHGHIAGDSCIKLVSSVVLRTVGDVGEAFRFGGEELCVILPGATLGEGQKMAEAVRVAVCEVGIPHYGLPGDEERVVSASLGVAEAHPARITADQMLVEADMALYQAKRLGKNRVHPKLVGIAA